MKLSIDLVKKGKDMCLPPTYNEGLLKRVGRGKSTKYELNE
jgi:hypothetical protein